MSLGSERQLWDDDVDYSVWTLKDSTKVFVKDITNEHLMNIINYINRNLSHSEEWFDMLCREAVSRGLTVPKKNPLFDCDATEIDIY